LVNRTQIKSLRILKILLINYWLFGCVFGQSYAETKKSIINLTE